MKVGWTPDYGYAKVDPEVLSICEKAANAFQSLGCSVSLSDFSIDDPFLPKILKRKYTDSFFVSSLNKDDMESLREDMDMVFDCYGIQLAYWAYKAMSK